MNPLIDNSGAKRWFQYGKLHRDDGPAFIAADGAESWFQHGEYHRDGGPAVIWEDGSEYWYQRGALHRTDGPAIIRAGGSTYWYIEHTRIQDWTEYQQLANLTNEELMILVLKYGDIA